VPRGCSILFTLRCFLPCQQVVLEAEASNTKAIALYESLGFFRDKRLEKYYLNGGDAFRLKKWFPDLDYSPLYT
jgi:ribosomal protein S18 acetylase RimI-like enzyme